MDDFGQNPLRIGHRPDIARTVAALGRHATLPRFDHLPPPADSSDTSVEHPTSTWRTALGPLMGSP